MSTRSALVCALIIVSSGCGAHPSGLDRSPPSTPRVVLDSRVFRVEGEVFADGQPIRERFVVLSDAPPPAATEPRQEYAGLPGSTGSGVLVVVERPSGAAATYTLVGGVPCVVSSSREAVIAFGDPSYGGR